MMTRKGYSTFCLSLIIVSMALFIVLDAHADTIIDNRDAATSSTGSWAQSLGAGSYGADSVFGRSGATFTWLFSPSQGGTHEVSMWWTYRDSRSTNIPVDIEHAGGTTRVFINQKQAGGGSIWNVLGAYTFNAGATYRITITAQPYPDSSSTTCADAVKFAYLSGGGNTPPAAIIDSITPNPALPGQTVTFTGHGTDSDGSIAAYEWKSGIAGLLGSLSTFSTATLAEGTHTITLRVQDNEGAWSSAVSRTLQVAGQTSNTENIYIGPIYDSSSTMYIGVLQGLGATQEGGTWKYINAGNNKTYIVHFLDNLDATRQAMYSEGSVIILQGHSNYGLGGLYSTPQENLEDKVYDLYYMDDDRLLNWSSPWVPMNVRDCIRNHAFPNWWPEFMDGTSAIMPYVFGDMRGNPAYNYYITYQVPGDATYYKIETVRNSGLQRFPDSGRSGWYSPSGMSPSPLNPDHLQYFITNTDTTPVTSLCGTRTCPRPHYGSKTIVFRKENEIEKDKLRYKKMLYASCTTGTYYLDTFQHGIMFYSVNSIGGTASPTFLRAYLQGKSDREIWELMQDVEPGYDYYNFDKLPSEQ